MPRPLSRRPARRGAVSILDGFQSAVVKPSGLTRGGEGDALSQQSFSATRRVSSVEANALYEANWLAGNIVDTLAEDLIQAGWKFVCDSDAELKRVIENDYLNLSLKASLFDTVRFALIDGDGYCSIGLREGRQPSPGSEPGTVLGIDYLHPFRRAAVKAQTRNLDPLSIDFGKWLHYTIMAGADGSTETPVHASRILHLQFFPPSTGDWGNSVYVRLYDPIQVADNALWSVGQVVYQMVFKVLKVDYEQFVSKAKALGLSARDLMLRWASDLNSLTMFIVDKGSKDVNPDALELPGLSSSLAAVPAVRDFILMVLSAATRIPQSRLVGNEQGKLSGAEWDAQNYYTRIRAMQELYIQPLIEKVTDHLLLAYGRDPSIVDYSIVFEPLFVESDETQALVQKAQAERDAIYIDRNVLTADEVRLERFGLGSLLEEVMGAQEEPETVTEGLPPSGA